MRRSSHMCSMLTNWHVDRIRAQKYDVQDTGVEGVFSS